MGLFQIIAIGVGLSMDACAVSISNVLSLSGGGRLRDLLPMPFLFGLFQALMPLLGYVAGAQLAGYVGAYGHLAVSAVLGYIAYSMIRNALREDKVQPLQKRLPLAMLLVQAVATAVDALFVGVSFGAAGILPIHVITIGITTFILVLFAIFLGKRLGERIGNRAEIVGGVLLALVALSALFT